MDILSTRLALQKLKQNRCVMVSVQIIDVAEANRARRALYCGVPRELMLAGQAYRGVVRSVSENVHNAGWTVKFIPQ